MGPTITATLFDNNLLRLRSETPDEIANIVTTYFSDATTSVNAAYTLIQLQRRHGSSLDRFLSDNRANIINADGFERHISEWKQRTGNLGVSSIMMTNNIFNSQPQLLPIIESKDHQYVNKQHVRDNF